MKTIAIISQKGGSGKTTLTLHLAVASAAAQLKTAIIDLDPQASAAKWGDRRDDDLPVVVSAHAARLENEMAKAREAGCEVLYIDTAPHTDSAAISTAKAADLILIPCRPAILDLEAISNTLDLVQRMGKPIAVVMNGVAAQGRDGAEAMEAIEALEVEVCPIHIGQRIAFSRALITGQTALEMEPEGKAAGEISALHDYVCTRAHIHTETAGPVTEERRA